MPESAHFLSFFKPAFFSRPKFSCSVRITHARQSFLLIRTGSMALMSPSQTKKPNLQSILLRQYSSLPRISWLYRCFSSRILSGVRFSKFLTARTVAVAQTGPELNFRNNLSPGKTRPKAYRLVLVKRDSIRFRPSKTASK